MNFLKRLVKSTLRFAREVVVGGLAMLVFAFFVPHVVLAGITLFGLILLDSLTKPNKYEYQTFYIDRA